MYNIKKIISNQNKIIKKKKNRKFVAYNHLNLSYKFLNDLIFKQFNGFDGFH